MKLLAGVCYDPAVAVTKSTAALLAMTAMDTTNLRLAFTVPSHGTVLVKMRGVLNGGTTLPQVLYGVLEGATVRGRAAPMTGGGNLATTSKIKAEADFLVTGLTPSANLSWDAAYSVDTLVASTGIKYGGPNNTVAADAFGGFSFEIYDPAPAGGAGGGATAAEVWAHATRTLTANPGIAAADVWTVATRALTDKAGFSLATTPPTAAQIRTEIDTNSTKLDAAVSTRMSTFTYTAPPSVAAIRTEIDTNSTKLDAAVSTRLASTSYAAPDNAGITTLTSRLTSGRAAAIDNLDAAVSSRLSSAGYTAPDNAGITAAAAAASAAAADAALVRAKTDLLDFTPMGCLKVDIICINGVVVTGAGTAELPWKAA